MCMYKTTDFKFLNLFFSLVGEKYCLGCFFIKSQVQFLSSAEASLNMSWIERHFYQKTENQLLKAYDRSANSAVYVK